MLFLRRCGAHALSPARPTCSMPPGSRRVAVVKNICLLGREASGKIRLLKPRFGRPNAPDVAPRAALGLSQFERIGRPAPQPPVNRAYVTQLFGLPARLLARLRARDRSGTNSTPREAPLPAPCRWHVSPATTIHGTSRTKLSSLPRVQAWRRPHTLMCGSVSSSARRNGLAWHRHSD